MRSALRIAVLAAIAVAWLALSAPASANGPCYVQEKTPTGFKLKCSEQLENLEGHAALSVFSSKSTNLTAVSINSPSGLTCTKDEATSPGLNIFRCSGTIAPNTEIIGSLSATGAEPCDINLYGEITYEYFGETQTPNIGSFDDCSDQPQKHPTNGAVSCTPKVVLLDQATTCTVTVADKQAGGTRPTGTVAFTNAPAAAGAFPGGATCVLKPVADVPRNSSCAVKYQPSSLGFTASHQIKAGYNGDSGHLSSLGQTAVTVKKRPTAAKIACDPAKPRVGKKTECTVTVSDTGAGTKSSPTGKVTLSDPAEKGKFPDGATCTLKKGAKPSEAQCTVVYKPTKKGGRELKAAYGGDGKHLGDTGTLNLKVKRKKPKS